MYFLTLHTEEPTHVTNLKLASNWIPIPSFSLVSAHLFRLSLCPMLLLYIKLPHYYVRYYFGRIHTLRKFLMKLNSAFPPWLKKKKIVYKYFMQWYVYCYFTVHYNLILRQVQLKPIWEWSWVKVPQQPESHHRHYTGVWLINKFVCTICKEFLTRQPKSFYHSFVIQQEHMAFQGLLQQFEAVKMAGSMCCNQNVQVPPTTWHLAGPKLCGPPGDEHCRAAECSCLWLFTQTFVLHFSMQVSRTSRVKLLTDCVITNLVVSRDPVWLHVHDQCLYSVLLVQMACNTVSLSWSSQLWHVSLSLLTCS